MDSVLSININVLKSVNDCNVSPMLAYKKDLYEQAVSDYHGGIGCWPSYTAENIGQYQVHGLSRVGSMRVWIGKRK